MRDGSITRRGFVVGGAIAAIEATTGFAAEDYPNRPIKLVVPFAAGSIADVIARHTFRARESRSRLSFY